MIEVNSKRKSMPSLHDPKKLSSDIKNHPCYQQWISNDMDYAGYQPCFTYPYPSLASNLELNRRLCRNSEHQDRGKEERTG